MRLGESRLSQPKAKQATRERSEWIGQPVDRPTTSATFAAKSQETAEGLGNTREYRRSKFHIDRE